MKKYHYTYLIYCSEPKSNMYGCIYYGKHSTNNLLDGYIASGKKIRRYINEYPNGYYRKILHLYNSEDELNKAEYELIHPHLHKEYCLNMMEGGHGGSTTILYNDYEKDQYRLKISKSCKGRNISKATREKISKSCKGRKSGFRDRHHSKKTKELISSKLKGCIPWDTGKTGPNYNKHRVYDNQEHTKYHYEKNI